MTDRPKWEPECVVPVHYVARMDLFSRLFERIKSVPGLVVECGVGRGTTFTMLAYLAGCQGRDIRGYDSFKGFPEPSPEDAGWRNPQKGEWKCNEALVWKHLHDSQVFAMFPAMKRWILAAYLEDILPNDAYYFYSRFPIAFLHLDVDLYRSYKYALENLWPHVSPGGIVLLDEYAEYSDKHPTEEKWPGATKAVDDYFIEHTGWELEQDHATGKWFAVK